MLAAIAEFERELIRERAAVMAGSWATAAGVKFGRKRPPSTISVLEPARRRAAGETLGIDRTKVTPAP